jgi:anti-anti-sigma factor
LTLSNERQSLASFQPTNAGDWPVLKIFGEVDVSNAASMTAAISDILERSDHLVIDLDEVTFMDSRALAVLIRASQRATEKGLRLVTATPRLIQLFQLSGVSDLFEVYPSVDAAIAEPI